MSKDAYYFSHDANARHDPKMLRLRAEFGVEGYAWYFMILEMMREQENYKLELTDLSAVVYELRTKKSRIKEFIEFCNEIDLLKKNENYLYSDSFLKRMQKYEDRKDSAKRAADIRWGNKPNDKEADEIQEQSGSDADALPSHNGCNANKSKGKERKIKKIKEVFDHWMDLENTISHKKFKDGYKKAILNALDDYSVTDLREAMSNYSEVLGRDDMFFKYKWTIIEFLTRGKKEGDEGKFIEKFLQGIEQFRKSGSENKKEANSGW